MVLVVHNSVCVEIEWDKSRQNYIGFKIKNWPTQLNVCVCEKQPLLFFLLSFFFVEGAHSNLNTLTILIHWIWDYNQQQFFLSWIKIFGSGFFIRSSSVIRQIFWINSSVYRMTNMYNVWTKMYIAYRQKKVLWNVFL